MEQNETANTRIIRLLKVERILAKLAKEEANNKEFVEIYGEAMMVIGGERRRLEAVTK